MIPQPPIPRRALDTKISLRIPTAYNLQWSTLRVYQSNIMAGRLTHKINEAILGSSLNFLIFCPPMGRFFVKTEKKLSESTQESVSVIRFLWKATSTSRNCFVMIHVALKTVSFKGGFTVVLISQLLDLLGSLNETNKLYANVFRRTWRIPWSL